MAKIPDIKIKFSAKGAKGLNQAIKTLDRSTKALVNSQAKMVAGSKKQERQNKKGIKSTRLLHNSFATLRSKMLLASFAGGIFAATIGKMAKMAGEQQRAESKLETAIGKRSNALLAFASQQQRVTAFGDEETITAMSLVGAYTDNEKAISRLTKVSMDLATAKGMDLKSAVDLVSKSVFSSTNALSRYGVTIEGSAGSVQRLESATSALTNLYGGQAEANAQTFLGTVDQLGNSLGDAGENIGFVFIPALTVASRGLITFADNLDTARIKSYITALGLVTAGYALYTLWAKRSAIATFKFSKALKMSGIGLVIIGTMKAVDMLNESFGFFTNEAKEAAKELKKLEGAMGDLNAEGVNTLELNQKLAMSEFKKGESYRLNADVFAEQRLLDEERRLTLEKYNITNDQFINGQVKNKEAVIAMNDIEVRAIALSERKRIVQAKSISSAVGALGSLNKAMKGSAVISKRLAQTQATIDTYAAASLALRTGTPPWNFIAMGTVIAAGLANVATIEAQQFAKGGDFVTNKPELIMVGEAGREHVQITPIDRPEERAMNGSGITVNINGGVVQEDYIRNELIPAINRSGVRVA
tara:strand:+ start:1485 stop:3248 length:1764 start_codon:yes stop_codon:yes gene_type:complete